MPAATRQRPGGRDGKRVSRTVWSAPRRNRISVLARVTTRNSITASIGSVCALPRIFRCSIAIKAAFRRARPKFEDKSNCSGRCASRRSRMPLRPIRNSCELQSQLQYYRAEIIPLAERTEATIHEAFAAGQIKADQMSILQRNFVRLRLKELALRYRFNRLSTRLEIFLGEPIVVP